MQRRPQYYLGTDGTGHRCWCAGGRLLQTSARELSPTVVIHSMYLAGKGCKNKTQDTFLLIAAMSSLQ